MGWASRANWSALKRQAFEEEDAKKRGAAREDFYVGPCSYCGSRFHQAGLCHLNPSRENLEVIKVKYAS